MTLAVVLVGVLLVLFVAPTAWAASIVVAAYDSTPQAKGRADIVCDGVNDEVELLASIADYAGTHSVEVDIAPNETKTVTALGRHSVPKARIRLQKLNRYFKKFLPLRPPCLGPGDRSNRRYDADVLRFGCWKT